jgi:RNA polymerase sigma-70 factor (ECF subfamily)
MPENLPDDQESPVDQAPHRETQALLATEIESLPEEFRGAFLLRVEEGLSFRDIANILSLTEETARWRVFKARQRLLKALDPTVEQEKP